MDARFGKCNGLGCEKQRASCHFPKSIPSIITNWLGPFIEQFLIDQELYSEQLTHFIAHPGGKRY